MNTVHLTMKGADTILKGLEDNRPPNDKALGAAKEYRDGVNVSNKMASLEPKNLFDAMISARSDIDAFIANLPKRSSYRAAGKPNIWYVCDKGQWRCCESKPYKSGVGVGESPIDAYNNWLEIRFVDHDLDEFYSRLKAKRAKKWLKKKLTN